ncbi:MAG: TlyA family RNA methyltransferase, partial [Propionibacteriaceae bacterium]|nr:TlyA family RNA methyltransferase [Propionibacteriaceae bacterium]
MSELGLQGRLTRLDRALVDRGLARSRGQAAELVAAGRVNVNGKPAAKASFPVTAADRVEAAADSSVSRAAYKLRCALDDSRTAVPACALDAGASTGGFTQVLLERGAKRVWAVDVGHGQLSSVLAADPRVVNREGLNLRDLTAADVGGQLVGLAVADVSFISLTLLLEPLLSVVSPCG